MYLGVVLVGGAGLLLLMLLLLPSFHGGLCHHQVVPVVAAACGRGEAGAAGNLARVFSKVEGLKSTAASSPSP